MALYKAPIRDMMFLLQDVLDTDKQLCQMPAYTEAGIDTLAAILEEAAKMAENILLPINASGDQQGCSLVGQTVSTPEGFKQAYKTFIEMGWMSLTGTPDYGGQGMPYTLGVLVEEMLYAANTSFTLYRSLSSGAYHAIEAYGSQALKDIYLPKLLDGTWTGTMCLTESNAGSDLSHLSTKAMPQADGSYKLNGTKIFITGGEQDLSENIIHLVLARLPDAPAGSKGISLFLVPKFLHKSLQSATQRNPIFCSAIESKMGIKASSTCVMNLEGATGFLLGKENAGLHCMFTMMNIERLSIGLQGLGLGEIAYQNAADYAKGRKQGTRGRQGRMPRTNQTDSQPQFIINHPDIRRQLLTMRALNEGNRALVCWVALQLDRQHHHPDHQQRLESRQLVEFLTPVVKAFLTDTGFDNCNLGLQIFGGHGYIRDWGMEQFVRDARIAQIYEGTNGIQSLDLTGRKLAFNNGLFFQVYCKYIDQFIGKYEGDVFLQEFIKPLSDAIDRLKNVSDWIMQKASIEPDELGAASVDYLHLVGLTTLAYLWAQMAEKAYSKNTHKPSPFLQSKLQTARFFMGRILPKTLFLEASIKSGAPLLMTPEMDAF